MKSVFNTTIVRILMTCFILACTDTPEELTSPLLLDHWQKKVNLNSSQLKMEANNILDFSEDDYLKAISSFTLGNIHGANGEYDKELAHYAEAIFFLNRSGSIDNKLLGHIYKNKGFVAKKYARYEEAVFYYDSALHHYKHFASDFTKEILSTTYNKANALKEIDLKKSTDVFEQLKNDSKTLGYVKYQLKALQQLGVINIIRGSYQEAEIYLEQALGTFDASNLDNEILEVQLLRSMANLYSNTKNYRKEETYLRRALDINSGYETFLTSLDLGICLYKQGKSNEALTFLTELEQGYDKEPFDKENIGLYEILSQISPDPSVYFEKERTERKKFESQMNMIVQQYKQDQLSGIEQNIDNLVEKDQVQAVFQKKEMILMSLFVMAVLFALVWVFMYYRKRYLDRKWFEETFKL